jgi:transposase
VFCDQYRRWHAGQTLSIVDRQTGESRAAQIFVAALGCSNLSHVEATSYQVSWCSTRLAAPTPNR